MCFRIGPLTAMLAVAVTAGCSIRTIEVHAVSDIEKGIKILTDREHHDSAVVHPGDKIRFKFDCSDCPAGASFTIEDLRFVGHLDDIADALERAGLTDPDRQGVAVDQTRETVNGGLRDLRSTFSTRKGPAAEGGEQGTPLFAKWKPPACCVPGREAIVTGRVAKLTQLAVWKFTWRVRLPDGREDSWDPHIFGHPDDHEWN